MKKIALIINFDKENALDTFKKLASITKGRAEFFCLPEDSDKLSDVTSLPEKELFSSCSIAAVLGGDGTIISAAKKCAPYKTILLGINVGHLGYLSTIESVNIDKAAELLLSDDIHYDERYMLSITVKRGEEEIHQHALNEIVLSRKSSSHLMNFAAYCNDKTVCRYRADGIIAATPTGSTAYSLAAGGPIVSPDAAAMLLTPICPHMLKARAIVLPPKKITLAVDKPAQLMVDGQHFGEVYPKDCIEIKKSPFVARLAHQSDVSFFDILQKKL